MEAQHRAKVAALREVEGGASKDPDSSSYLVLRFGIEFNEWVADWCARTASELEAESASVGSS